MAASVVVTADGKHELSEELPRSQLYNKDLAPTPARLRNWGLYSFLAFWVGCCVVIPSWSLANIGLVFGFDPATSIFVVILGNAIVTVPLLLNSHVGAKYGIAFPLFLFLYLGLKVGFDKMFTFQLTPDKPLGGGFYFWFLLLNINVGFWATMALNISDVTRFAKEQTRQMIGQAIGLVGTMAFFSGMGVLVTAGGVTAYTETAKDTANQLGTANDLWNPINLFAKLSGDLGPIIIVLALVFVVLAQLSTNIGANVIAHANDFQHLVPKRLNSAWGAVITAVLGTQRPPWCCS